MTGKVEDSIDLLPELVTDIFDCMVSSGKVVHCFEEILVGKERYEITISDHQTMVIKKYTDDIATMSITVKTREYRIYEDGTIKVICTDEDETVDGRSEILLNLDTVSENMAFLLRMELVPVLKNLKEQFPDYW